MFEATVILGATQSDYGPFSDIVQYATCAVVTATALFVLVRGRNRKWEPADSEVPRLAEKTAIAAGAIITALVFGVMNGPSFKIPMATASGVALALMIGAFVCFVSLSEHHLHDAPDKVKDGDHLTQKIIGDEQHLTPEARQKRKEGVTLRDLIFGCGKNWDAVFSRQWRSRMKVRFQIAYFFLVLSFIVAMACAGQFVAIIR